MSYSDSLSNYSVTPAKSRDTGYFEQNKLTDSLIKLCIYRRKEHPKPAQGDIDKLLKTIGSLARENDLKSKSALVSLCSEKLIADYLQLALDSLQ